MGLFLDQVFVVQMKNIIMDGVFSTKWGNYVARSVESMVLRCMAGTAYGPGKNDKTEKTDKSDNMPSAEAMWSLQCRLSGNFLNDAAQWVCMDFVIRHYPANAEFQVPASALQFDQVLNRFVTELARSDLIRDKKLWTMLPQARLDEICKRLLSCMKRTLTKHVRLCPTDTSVPQTVDTPDLDSDVRVVELSANECIGFQNVIPGSDN